MKTIITPADLNELECGLFPKPLLQFARDLLCTLWEECDGDERFLRENPVYIIEADDPLLTLLAESPFSPEYVERIDLPSLIVYRVGVLMDNDSFAQYLIPAGTLDGETNNWLVENATAGGEAR